MQRQKGNKLHGCQGTNRTNGPANEFCQKAAEFSGKGAPTYAKANHYYCWINFDKILAFPRQNRKLIWKKANLGK
jgi:hypothetical protein